MDKKSVIIDKISQEAQALLASFQNKKSSKTPKKEKKDVLSRLGFKKADGTVEPTKFGGILAGKERGELPTTAHSKKVKSFSKSPQTKFKPTSSYEDKNRKIEQSSFFSLPKKPSRKSMGFDFSKITRSGTPLLALVILVTVALGGMGVYSFFDSDQAPKTISESAPATPTTSISEEPADDSSAYESYEEDTSSYTDNTYYPPDDTNSTGNSTG